MLHNYPIRFKSRFLFGGTLFTRDIIEIDEVFITLRHKGFFKNPKKSVNIPLGNIKTIGLKNTFTGVSVFVESFAHRSFKANGFSAKAAREISKAIESFKISTKKESFI